ncbi:protein-L-isoaspartate O-methyltransferase [Methanolobus halotolerans]|uniref:Protein-L-isoaspartate O-methyltransferase n=1 Tax=Methanolobus halotolerans TaxID=2052935 RepID=A0A4E0PYQ9_9EURY|nr:protein-L-isoaspartate O-methyltransferase [Methanolobus halotolerans]TGC08930.1 protein-L-isoaspartate O-methyltransferase [Methanolobus halotolerans]
MEYARQKERLVSSLSSYGISDRVLDALRKVPRHLFVPEVHRDRSYVDTPLSIGYAQTISAPHMVAIMCDLLELEIGLKVLEVGAGSGYNAAVMAELVDSKGKIYSVERLEPLAGFARVNLEKAGYDNVDIILADGSLGYPQEAPYDRICVTASAPCTPRALVEQLRTGGLMAIPEGDMYQHLYLIKKEDDGSLVRKDCGGVTFVPLMGANGFRFESKP